MSDEFNNDSMLELYLFEATSLLDGLDAILLEAEQSHMLGKDDVNEIFRIMHTIKGSSAMMAFDAVAEVAHRTEDVFSVIREHGLDDSNFGSLFDLVLKASKFLEDEIAKIQSGANLSSGAPELIKELEDYAGLLRAACPAPGPKPDLGRMLGSAPKVIPLSFGERREDPPGEEDRSMASGDGTVPTAAPALPPFDGALRAPAAPGGVDAGGMAGGDSPAPTLDSMPVAPEGGRILGLEPTAQATEPPVPAPEVKVHESAPVAPGGENTVFLHVHFNDGAKMENIRAFMLVSKLSELGAVNGTLPDRLEDNPEATDYIIENGFYISFTSNMFREQIEAAVRGTLSVESVSFMRKMPPEFSEMRKDISEGALPPSDGGEDFSSVASGDGTVPTTDPASPGGEDYSGVARGDEKMSTAGPASPEGEEDGGVARGDGSGPTAAPASPEGGEDGGVARGDGSEGIPAEPAAAPAPQAEPAAAPASAPTHAPAKQNLISVDTKKLDSLLDLVGEIVINESLVAENPDLAGLEPQSLENFNKAARQLGKLTDELQDSVMAVRLVPVQATFQRLRRGIRDMSKDLGKDVELVLLGETTEVDKTILDAIADPLMHLVRNAVDHAIETPAERLAAGKGKTGHITLSAQNVGGDVIISVSDDGRGLDREKILATAMSKGLLRKPVSEYTDREVHQLLMEPGFSTKAEITAYSGRGVGLDVVKMNIERIGGAVIIESVRGVGTNVLMKIPLTLAIIDCMELRVGPEIFALPVGNIKESFQASAGQVVSDPNGNEMIILRGVVYPVVRLYERLGVRGATKDLDKGMLVLTDATDREGCLLVDELVGKFQVVVKEIPAYLKGFGIRSRGLSGCTILGDGNVIFLLDVQELLA